MRHKDKPPGDFGGDGLGGDKGQWGVFIY